MTRMGLFLVFLRLMKRVERGKDNTSKILLGRGYKRRKRDSLFRKSESFIKHIYIKVEITNRKCLLRRGAP